MKKTISLSIILIMSSLCFGIYEYAKINIGSDWDSNGDGPFNSIPFAFQEYYTGLDWHTNGLIVPLPGRKIDFYIKSHRVDSLNKSQGYDDYWNNYGWNIQEKRTDKYGFWLGYIGYGMLVNDFFFEGMQGGNGLTEVPKIYNRHYTEGQVGLKLHNGNNYSESLANFYFRISAAFPSQDPNINSGWPWLYVELYNCATQPYEPAVYCQNNIPNPQESYNYPIHYEMNGYYILDKNSVSLKYTPNLLVNYIQGDGNEPNTIEKQQFIENNWPFTFVTIQPDWPKCKQTMLINSHSFVNRIVDKQLIDFYYLGDDKYISAYFYPIGDFNERGIYHDSCGNRYVCIYAISYELYPDYSGWISFTQIPEKDYGDFDFNGRVNFTDYALFLKHYELTISDPNFNSMYDYNKDGVVDIVDLRIFIDHWLNYKSKCDFNSDRKVNYIDFARMANKYKNIGDNVVLYEQVNLDSYDFNKDNAIDLKDFRIFFQDWLKGK